MNTYQEQVALNNMLSEANGEITSLKAQLAAAQKQNAEAKAVLDRGTALIDSMAAERDAAKMALLEAEAKCAEMRDFIQHEYDETDGYSLTIAEHGRQNWILKCLSLDCGSGFVPHADLDRAEKERDEARTELDKVGKEHDEEIGEFQNEVRALIIRITGAPDNAIDGKGSDAGWEEFTLAEIGQGLAFVIDQRDEARAEATKLRDAGKALVEALEEAKQALVEGEAYGSCDCDIPNGKTCPVCQCALAHKRAVEALARAKEAGLNP